LWIASRLNVGIEIDCILGEFLRPEASPDAVAFWRQRLGTIATSSNLIAENMHSA
jgi:hypothetical protein